MKYTDELFTDIFCNDLVSEVFNYHKNINTCAHDSCKHPALSILDWSVTRLSPLPQDFPTPSPQGGINPFFEVTRPVSFQHSTVIFTVDLNREDKCQFLEIIKQAQASLIFSDSQWQLLTTLIDCFTACVQNFSRSRIICRTLFQFEPWHVFNEQQLWVVMSLYKEVKNNKTLWDCKWFIPVLKFIR